MNTDHLITALSADTEMEPGLRAALPRALLAACLVAALLFLSLVGLRPDAPQALTQWNVLLKQAFPILLALSAFGAVRRLARPAAPVGGWCAALAVTPFLLAGAVLATLTALPPDAWRAAMMGRTHLFCAVVIPLVSLPMLGASLWALRRGASTRPMLTGAVAGLLSGGAGAAIYATHCPEDSPLFYATWYGLGILIVAALGALFGPRVLRW